MTSPHEPTASGAAGLDLSERLATTVERAQQLARTPDGGRDLAWHVESFFVGDLTALVTARLRAPR